MKTLFHRSDTYYIHRPHLFYPPSPTLYTQQRMATVQIIRQWVLTVPHYRK